MPLISQKPYLIKAIYQWINDNELTPYIATLVTPGIMVPQEQVNDNQIILNLSSSATRNLDINKQCISFDACFNGVVTNINIPINNVIAIFAKENSQGMQFEVDKQSIIGAKSTSLKLVK